MCVWGGGGVAERESDRERVTERLRERGSIERVTEKVGERGSIESVTERVGEKGSERENPTERGLVREIDRERDRDRERGRARVTEIEGGIYYCVRNLRWGIWGLGWSTEV